jgi:methylthioribose-1-phosphate isomerase
MRMGESSIAWVDGALVVIDQRALPAELRELRITTVDEIIDAIETLAIRGAPAIGVSGAFGVVLAVFAHGGETRKVRLDAERIAAARPTAVNLAWGVRRALDALPRGPRAVLDEALAMLAEDGRVNRAAAAHAADLVQRLCPDRPLRILTHCNTGRLATTAFGTALGAVRVLYARGAVESVLVDETRPLLQGARLTAWELAEAGIPHRLTIDSAAAWSMATGQVDCVLVGADRITADGSVANKIGTYMLALAAHYHGVPFIVVAPESTRDPATATGRDIVVEERAAREITQIGAKALAPTETRVFNPAFDVTPPEFVTAVVTENGVVGGRYHSSSSRPGPADRGIATAQLEPATATSQENSGPNPLAARDGLASAAVAGVRPGGERIAEVAHELYLRGWMPGTAGNVSVRMGETALVTGSGLSKGELSAEDMVTVAVADSRVLGGARRPSAETAIHTAVYRATDAGAVVHVHSPHATAQSVGAPISLRFSGYELIKGLAPVAQGKVSIDIPVFSNHADVPSIGADIERHLAGHPDAPPVLFIAGHGITAWGATVEQARDRAECLEALCELAALTGRRTLVGTHHSFEEQSQ